MATTIGDSRLASRLSIKDLGANSSFYHKRCYAKLYNDFIKKDDEKKQGGIDIPQIRAAAWDKVVAFVDEAKTTAVDWIYMTYRTLIFCPNIVSKSVEMSHVFGEDLLEKAPNYEIIKDQETRVFRKESV